MCRNGHKDVFQTFCSWMREGRWVYCVIGLVRKSFGPTSQMGILFQLFLCYFFWALLFCTFWAFRKCIVT